jgi:hypothetical protein
MRRPIGVLVEGIVIICAMVLLGTSIWVFGHQQLGGFDHSFLIDTCWRLFNSQKPYHDFYLTTPVGFFLGGALAFKLWGVKWSALVIIAIAFSLITFLTHVILLKRLISWKYSVFLALVCQLLTMVVISYWWYNSISLISACLFMTASLVFFQKPKNWVNCFFFCASLALLMLMKPNVAGLIIVPIVCIFFIEKQYRLRISSLVVVSSIFVILILLLLKINPIDVLSSYIGVAHSRVMPSPLKFFRASREEAFITIPMIFLCLIPFSAVLGSFRGWRQFWSSQMRIPILISFVGIFGGYYCSITNLDSNLLNISLVFLSGTSLVLILNQLNSPNHKAGWILVLSSIFSAGAIVLRFGVRSYYWINNTHYLGDRSLFGFLSTPVGFFMGGLWMALSVLAIIGIIWAPFGLSSNHIPLISKWLRNLDRIKSTTLIWLIIIVCGLVAIYVGGMRWRVKYIGPFYADGALVTIPELEFFDNFHVSPQAANIVREIDIVLKSKFGQNRQEDISVFFGPRMEFAYAAFGIQSPIQSPLMLPIWYDPGAGFPVDKTQNVVDGFISHRFNLCVFVKNLFVKDLSVQSDFTYLPDGIVQELKKSYKQKNYSDIIVFERVNQSL